MHFAEDLQIKYHYIYILYVHVYVYFNVDLYYFC